MKAFTISDENVDEGGLIIFAETRNKARVIAQGRYPFEDSNYYDINAKREKSVDSYYTPGRHIIGVDSQADQQLHFDLGWYMIDGHDCEGCGLHHWDLVPESHSNNIIDWYNYCNECFEQELNKGLLGHFRVATTDAEATHNIEWDYEVPD